MLVGIAAIVWGTRITLDNAVWIAGHYRVSDFFVGAVILAVGSDLPEIVVSIAAALRQLEGIATADLIGSNVLDVLLPVGLAAALVPLEFSVALLKIDWLVLFGLTLLVLGLLLSIRGIRKPQALLIGACYLAYLLSFAWRN